MTCTLKQYKDYILKTKRQEDLVNKTNSKIKVFRFFEHLDITLEQLDEVRTHNHL